ncbi:MAG: hypothetical protein ACQEP8_01625 [Chlamydiota bacterium]
MTSSTLKANATLKVLLNRFHSGSIDAFSEFLASKDAEELQAIPLTNGDINVIASFPEEILKELHYSWLLSFFKKSSPAMQRLFLAIVTPSQRRSVMKVLSLSDPEIELPSCAERYFKNQLFTALEADKVMPKSWLSPSDLQPLLSMEHHHLVNIADYLGLYDLAKAIPKVLDPRLLHKVYNTLSKPKTAYVKKCMQIHDRLSLPALSLSHWDGDKLKLAKVIHQRGLMRLALALYGESPQFLWHFFHHLDTGRAAYIKKHIPQNLSSDIHSIALRQAKKVINIFKEGH